MKHLWSGHFSLWAGDGWSSCRGKAAVWCERKRRFLLCKILPCSWTWRMRSASKSASSCKCIWLVNSHRPHTFPTNQTVLITRCFFYLPFWFHSHLSCFLIACVGLCWFDFSLPPSVFSFVIFIFLAFALVKLHSISDIPGYLHIVAWSGSSLCVLLYLFIHSGWSLMFAALSAAISNVKLSSCCTELFPSNICSANSWAHF